MSPFDRPEKTRVIDELDATDRLGELARHAAHQEREPRAEGEHQHRAESEEAQALLVAAALELARVDGHAEAREVELGLLVRNEHEVTVVPCRELVDRVFARDLRSGPTLVVGNGNGPGDHRGVDNLSVPQVDLAGPMLPGQ